QIARSNSRNAVNLSLARTMKRFPYPCAFTKSAAQRSFATSYTRERRRPKCREANAIGRDYILRAPAASNPPTAECACRAMGDQTGTPEVERNWFAPFVAKKRCFRAGHIRRAPCK